MSESLQFTRSRAGGGGLDRRLGSGGPRVHSQRRARDEARANMIDALRDILELRFDGAPKLSEGADSEPLKVVIGA